MNLEKRGYIVMWGGVKLDFENKGSRIMRFQTNMGYANLKKWDGVCF